MMENSLKGGSQQDQDLGVDNSPPDGVDNIGFEVSEHSIDSAGVDIVHTEQTGQSNPKSDVTSDMRSPKDKPKVNGHRDTHQLKSDTDEQSHDGEVKASIRRSSEGDVYENAAKNMENLCPKDFLFLGRSCYSIPISVIDEKEPRCRQRRMEIGSSKSNIGVVSRDCSPNWKLPIDEFKSKRQGENGGHKKLSKDLRNYYKAQDKLISTYEEVEMEIEDFSQINRSARKAATRLAKITFICNLCLLIAKLTAAILSGSMAIISSLVDSIVDLASGFTIWATSRYAKKPDPYVYPQGRSKLEPLGIVILAVIMSAASFVLILESIQRIIGFAGDRSLDAPTMGPATIAIACGTIVVKLVLFLICRRNPHPAIKVLTVDHRNDVFANTVAVVCGYLASKNFRDISGKWEMVFIDSIGAILISIYIVYSWVSILRVQIKVLTGYTAKPDFLSKITWLCINHHKEIQYLDTVRAFHFGNNFLVEVHIVLPESLTLKEAHNIGEPLQQKLENLPEVERAFVHIDYEFEHHPWVEHKRV